MDGQSAAWRHRNWILFLLVATLLNGSAAAERSLPKRIVSTAPSLTEMLFALELGERVVGATTYCNHPKAAQAIPRIGDFASPSVEAILRQSPDLILVLQGRGQLERNLRALRVPILALGHETLEDILNSIRMLAEATGAVERGERLAAEISGQLKEVEQRRRNGPSPQVLFLVGRNPGSLSHMYAAGPRSYLGELIRLAGGENFVRDSRSPYPKVTVEEVMRRNPEVIIDMSMAHGESPGSEASPDLAELWARFSGLQAAGQRRIYTVSDDIFLLPGPRVAEAVLRLESLIFGGPAQ